MSGSAPPGAGVQESLVAARDTRPLLVPYVTGGVQPDWADCLHAYAEAGADAIEIGLPFSDPMLDGPVIQAASQRALDRGVTPGQVLEAVTRADVAVPLIAMTYTNIVVRAGMRRFCGSLREAGIRGLIVPDTPWAEMAPLQAAAESAEVELILLVAPSTPAAQLRQIAERSRGFVYAVSHMGTTGETPELPAAATELAARLRPHARAPVLIGFGVGTVHHALRAVPAADGVVVASALMRRLLHGAKPAELGAELRRWRTALDGPRRR